MPSSHSYDHGRENCPLKAQTNQVPTICHLITHVPKYKTSIRITIHQSYLLKRWLQHEKDWLPCNIYKFIDSCNNLLSSVHTVSVIHSAAVAV